MIETFAIPLAFIIVSSLTLWIVIGSKGWWWLKGLMVVLTSAFSVSLWLSLNALLGWPTQDVIPEKFEIKWVVAEEPNKITNSEGAIYVWLKDLDSGKKSHSWYMSRRFNKIEDEPRIHKLPYSRSMHEQAVKIQAKIASGGKFYGERNGDGAPGEGRNGKGKGKGKGQGPQGTNERGRGDGSQGSLSQEQDFIFHELPPPSYPEKNQ